MTGRHVFLSYSRQNSEYAFQLYDYLTSGGLRVWIDQRSIRPGESYAAAIYTAIEQAYTVVLLFSAAANQSREIHREVQIASDCSVPIIPLRLETLKYHPAIGYHLAATQWIDGSEDFEEALATVRALLLRIAPAEPHSRTAPPPAPELPNGREGLVPREGTQPTDHESASASSGAVHAMSLQQGDPAPARPTRQDELAAAIYQEFPDAVVKRIDTGDGFYLHLPSVNRKWETHLMFNTSTERLFFHFHVQDPAFIAAALSGGGDLEATASTVRLRGNPTFGTVADAANAAVHFVRLLESRCQSGTAGGVTPQKMERLLRQQQLAVAIQQVYPESTVTKIGVDNSVYVQMPFIHTKHTSCLEFRTPRDIVNLGGQPWMRKSHARYTAYSPLPVFRCLSRRYRDPAQGTAASRALSRPTDE
jgi:hypothetical protein